MYLKQQYRHFYLTIQQILSLTLPRKVSRQGQILVPPLFQFTPVFQCPPMFQYIPIFSAPQISSALVCFSAPCVSVHYLALNVAIEAFDAHGLRGQNDRMLGKCSIPTKYNISEKNITY